MFVHTLTRLKIDSDTAMATSALEKRVANVSERNITICISVLDRILDNVVTYVMCRSIGRLNDYRARTLEQQAVQKSEDRYRPRANESES